ncbi:SMC-Scp complex subunit ScpB [Thermoplasma sp.]|uniref:SMC-Scp complex subunit ScpB n=1 Tax=Thermoplasma sp. TaxID=1973142 RepID=UPI002625536A|nr:SMC-Scp complex subunit ScpB [Thermoplasma sp.]
MIDDAEKDLINRVEAILYSSRTPLNVRFISQILSADPSNIRKAIVKLKKEYEERDGALELAAYGYKYRIQLRSDYFKEAYAVSPPDISGSEMKVLANIAMNERGISSSVIRKIAHKRTDEIIEHLEGMGLIKAVNRGNAKFYILGRRFESYFGVSKEEFTRRIKTELQKKKQDEAGGKIDSGES